MPANNKRCPQCSGEIDVFGSCRRCGREWSDTLEPDELAHGLPDGQQHPAEVKKVGNRKTRKSRFTKSKDEIDGKKFKQFGMDVAPRYAGWQIDAELDDETEIIRKRSLMHLDSRKTYNALGLSMRAKNAQKGALLWLSRLWEFLSEDEQKVLGTTMERLKQGFADIEALTEMKLTETAQMERALDKAHGSARRARLRIIDADKRKMALNIMPGQDTEGFGVPVPATIDPKLLTDPALNPELTKEELIELAKAKLAHIDQEKALRKRMQGGSSRKDPLESE